MHGLRPSGHCFGVRMLIERIGGELPHALERRIVQAHAAVRTKHRHRFGQVIERFALHFDECVIAPVHVEALGNVVVEIGNAALRIGRGDDAQCAAVRQVPHMLLRFDRGIGFVKLLLPQPEILLLGQLAVGAQGVEHGRVGWRLVEKGGVEFEQRAEGGVAEDQLAVGVEDGDAGGELIEHAAMRLDHAGEFGAHGGNFGTVDRHAGAAASGRRVDHVENTTLAGRDSRQPPGKRFGLGARARKIVPRAAVEQFELARHCIDGILGIDRLGVSRIHEDQPAAGVAGPDRRRQRIKQHLHGFDIAGQLVVAGGKFDQFALDAADVAQAQDRAPGHRATFGLDRPPHARCQRHHKAAALAAQRLDRALHALRRRRFEPAAESQYAFRHATGDNNAGVSDDVRRVVRRVPGHQHLRFRQQQRLEPVDLGTQRHAVFGRRGFGPMCRLAHADQHDGGEHRETEQPKHQSESC